MAGIGFYIHYNAENYNKHGITFKGSKETYNFAQQKEHIKKRLKGSNLKNKKQLEDTLESIFSTKDNSNVNSAQIRNEIQSLLEERFGETLGRIKWETGDVVNIKEAKKKTTTLLNTSAQQENVLVKSILTRIKAIEDARNSIKEEEDKVALTNKINQIYKDLNYVLTGTQKGLVTKLKNRDSEIMNKKVSLRGSGRR